MFAKMNRKLQKKSVTTSTATMKGEPLSATMATITSSSAPVGASTTATTLSTLSTLSALSTHPMHRHRKLRKEEQLTKTSITTASEAARSIAKDILTRIPKMATTHTTRNENGNTVTILQKLPRHVDRLKSQEVAEKVLRISRRTAMSELASVSEKMLMPRNKNEEAICNLQKRIPEIVKIFDVHCRIGSGTFSTVLLATLKREREMPYDMRQKYAIKHHNASSNPERIIRELECMFKMGGLNNVININCCIRYNEAIAFIMPYLPHERFHDFYIKMDLDEIKCYMKNLLTALAHVHKFNVIHRDVKPSNILYNRKSREFLLVDFGLAQQLTEDGRVATIQELSSSLSSIMKTKLASWANKPNSPNENTTSETSITKASYACSHNRITTARDHDTARRMRALAEQKANPTKEEIIAATLAYDAKREAALAAKQAKQTKEATAAPQRQKAGTTGGVDINDYVVPTNRVFSSNGTYKKEMHASRAGTPGYRPPEVLLRYPFQTTAVDVWAAGVILLSILSSLHPFFKAPNDCTALTEMVSLFGDMTIRRTAFMLDRLVMLTQKANPLDLRRVCLRFRNSDYFSSQELLKKYRKADGTCDVCKNCNQYCYNCLCLNTSFRIESLDHLDIFPRSAYDLLTRLLEVNPFKRITAEEALNHPFFDESKPISGNGSHSHSKATMLTKTIKSPTNPSKATNTCFSTNFKSIKKATA